MHTSLPVNFVLGISLLLVVNPAAMTLSGYVRQVCGGGGRGGSMVQRTWHCPGSVRYRPVIQRVNAPARSAVQFHAH